MEIKVYNKIELTFSVDEANSFGRELKNTLHYEELSSKTKEIIDKIIINTTDYDN